MKLYIMRHGETDWNKKGLIQGSADIPLNDYGIELAELTRDGLKKAGIHFDKVFTSPYIRARYTAEIILEERQELLTADGQIREMSFGAYEGIKIGELRTNPQYQRINMCFDDPVRYVPEEGAESYEEVFARVSSFLTDTVLPLEKTCDNVLVVCHGAVIRAFFCIFKQLALEEYWSIHQPNCSVNVVDLTEGRFSLERENWLFYEKRTSPDGNTPERRFV